MDEEEDTSKPSDDVAIFSSLPYTAEDEEADQIWQSIDEKMDERRKKRREKRENEEYEKFKRVRPEISDLFADAKRQLASVSEDEWAAIPEVGDHRSKRTRKNKNADKERILPVPDSILMGDGGGGMSHAVSSMDMGPSGLVTPLADFKKMGEARENMLRIKLDKVKSG